MNENTKLQTKPLPPQARAIRAAVMILSIANRDLEAKLAAKTTELSSVAAEKAQLEGYNKNLQKRLTEAQDKIVQLQDWQTLPFADVVMTAVGD